MEDIRITSLTNDQIDFVKDLLIGPAVNYLSSIIKVDDDATIPSIPESGCLENMNTPLHYQNNSTNAHLLIFIQSKIIEGSTLAYAGSCYLNSSTKRPVIGLIMINSRNLTINYENSVLGKDIIIHEIFHVLGFSNSMMEYYPSNLDKDFFIVTNKTTKSGNQKEVVAITEPSFLDFVKSYYNCSSISTFYLENQGGEGTKSSHFEVTAVGQELMQGMAFDGNNISIISLTFLYNMGWYSVDLTKAQLHTWGKGKGCDFLSSSCDSNRFNEFCNTPNEISCSENRLNKTKCFLTTLSDNCGVKFEESTLSCSNKNYFKASVENEITGNNSRCYNVRSGSINSAGCFDSDCSYSNINYKIKYKDNVYECNSTNKEFTIDNITIECPPYSEICGIPHCPNNCSGNGKCLDSGVCTCDYLFSGSDCSTLLSCKSTENVCNQVKPKNISSGWTVENIPFNFYSRMVLTKIMIIIFILLN